MRASRIILAIVAALHCLWLAAPLQRASAQPFDSQTEPFDMFVGDKPQSTQSQYNPLSGPSYPIEQNTYFTDDNGNILMVVNVLGAVNKPGQIIVSENADFSTILAMAGGTTDEANIKKVVVARRDPDTAGNMSYKVNLKKYYKEGDRSGFIALRPNDTVIVPDKKGVSLDNAASVMGIAFGGLSIFSLF